MARRWIGLDGLFSPRTVVVADDRTPPVEPNPLLNPAGRHRLELASPEIWWPLIQKVPDSEVAQQIVSVATHVAQSHDAAFGVDPLRHAAEESIGRAGAGHVWQQVAERCSPPRPMW